MCEYGCYHAGPIDWSWLKGALLVIGLLSLAFVAGCTSTRGQAIDAQEAVARVRRRFDIFTTDDGVRCVAYIYGGIDCDFANPLPQSDLRQGAFVP